MLRALIKTPKSSVLRVVSRRVPSTFAFTSVSVMSKRKRSTVAVSAVEANDAPPIPPAKSSKRKASRSHTVTNPENSKHVVDGLSALRASPDAEVNGEVLHSAVNGVHGSDLPQSGLGEADKKPKKQPNKTNTSKIKQEDTDDPAPRQSQKKLVKQSDEAFDPDAEEGDEEADPEEIKQALSRPPPVDSDYLPLPWKGRLGYACLCTYLRYSNPPIFCSRTTRIASILEHRHPLKDPSQPEHATKNRPDKEQPADIRRGQEFIERLCLANIKDMSKLIRWNDKYGIRFLRLSSEAFPFASHAEYGYKLAPFAAEALAEVGKVAAELGHRLTTHPGQFTQLGSPRESVIEASIRDLEYHDEMLSLLKLPPQQDRDAIMVLHMGGVYGDKAATLDRFRENYKKLSPSIKERLVLENDDVCYSVHDLLPICKELNIPFVLDFHHNNIIFDEDKIREGTKDIMELFPEIIETWRRKKKTPKMHYSEPTPAAITPRQRRKHNPRVATLPPCPNDMDLMIEAKDKEQAVFELMRTFKLPGWDTFNDIIPYVRNDDNKPDPASRKKATPKKKGKRAAEEPDDDDAVDAAATPIKANVSEEEIGMGGPEHRVYWPPGMEEWLRPKKRVVKKKEDTSGEAQKLTPSQKRAANYEKAQAEKERKRMAEAAVEAVDTPKATANGKGKQGKTVKAEESGPATNSVPITSAVNGKLTSKAKATAKKPKIESRESTPWSTEDDDDVGVDINWQEDEDDDDNDAEPLPRKQKRKPTLARRASSRSKGPTSVNYNVDDDEDEDLD